MRPKRYRERSLSPSRRILENAAFVGPSAWSISAATRVVVRLVSAVSAHAQSAPANAAASAPRSDGNGTTFELNPDAPTHANRSGCGLDRATEAPATVLGGRG